jgi:Fic family protein
MNSQGIDKRTAIGVGAPDLAKNGAPVVTDDVPQDCWPLLVAAIEAAATLEAHGALLANPRMLLRPLHVAEALASVRLNGGEASVEELLRYEVGALDSVDGKDGSSSVREAANCLSAVRYGEERLDDLAFSTRLLQGLHRMLTFRLGDDLGPGEFRHDDDVQQALPSLEAAMNADAPIHLRLVHALDVHRRFMTLAPFHSASGRLARIVLALMLQQLNRHSAPWLGLSAVFAAKQREYRAAISGDSDSWIKFGLERIADAAWNGVTLCHRVTEAHRELEAKLHEANGGERDSRLLELLFESPIVTVPLIERRLVFPYTTAKRCVQRFIALGLLRQLGCDSAKAFGCKSILTAWVGWVDAAKPTLPITADKHAARSGSCCRR